MATEETTLKGQVAVVTGGGRGLGRAFAQAIAAAGARVGVVARSADQLAETVRLLEADGGRAVACVADVSAAEAVRAAFAEIAAQLGPIDLLVNNGGVMSPIGMDWEVDADEWWRTMEINVRGPFVCSQAVLPGMIERKRGRIVNISSMLAWYPMSYASAYPASKAALTNLTRSLALAVKPHGIAVLAYGPGYVMTDMGRGLAESNEVEKYAGSFYRVALERGLHVPLERTVPKFMLLAAGAADALSGCHLDVEDDIPALLARADEIQGNGLYTLARKT